MIQNGNQDQQNGKVLSHIRRILLIFVCMVTLVLSEFARLVDPEGLPSQDKKETMKIFDRNAR